MSPADEPRGQRSDVACTFVAGQPDVLVLHLLHSAHTDTLCADGDAIYRAGRPLPSDVLAVAQRLLSDGHLREVVDAGHPATMTRRLRLSDSGAALMRTIADRPADPADDGPR